MVVLLAGSRIRLAVSGTDRGGAEGHGVCRTPTVNQFQRVSVLRIPGVQKRDLPNLLQQI